MGFTIYYLYLITPPHYSYQRSSASPRLNDNYVSIEG